MLHIFSGTSKEGYSCIPVGCTGDFIDDDVGSREDTASSYTALNGSYSFISQMWRGCAVCEVPDESDFSVFPPKTTRDFRVLALFDSIDFRQNVRRAKLYIRLCKQDPEYRDYSPIEITTSLDFHQFENKDVTLVQRVSFPVEKMTIRVFSPAGKELTDTPLVTVQDGLMRVPLGSIVYSVDFVRHVWIAKRGRPEIIRFSEAWNVMPPETPDLLTEKTWKTVLQQIWEEEKL